MISITAILIKRRYTSTLSGLVFGCVSNRTSTSASSSAWPAPAPRCGNVPCAASPSTAARPRTYVWSSGSTAWIAQTLGAPRFPMQLRRRVTSVPHPEYSALSSPGVRWVTQGVPGGKGRAPQGMLRSQVKATTLICRIYVINRLYEYRDCVLLSCS